MDVFALGAILYIILTSNFPFAKAGDKYHYQLIKNPKTTIKGRGFDLEEEAIDLIARMLSLDPDQRPTIK